MRAVNGWRNLALIQWVLDQRPLPPAERAVLAAVLVYWSRERTVAQAREAAALTQHRIGFDDLARVHEWLHASAYRNPYPITWIGPVL